MNRNSFFMPCLVWFVLCLGNIKVCICLILFVRGEQVTASKICRHVRPNLFRMGGPANRSNKQPSNIALLWIMHQDVSSVHCEKMRALQPNSTDILHPSNKYVFELVYEILVYFFFGILEKTLRHNPPRSKHFYYTAVLFCTKNLVSTCFKMLYPR